MSDDVADVVVVISEDVCRVTGYFGHFLCIQYCCVN